MPRTHLTWSEDVRPPRAAITEAYYPKRVAVEVFAELLQGNLDLFVKNMVALRETYPGDPAVGDRWPEEWLGIFAAWSEMIP